MYKLYTFFVGCNALVLPLQHFTFMLNQIVVTTMKRMLNRMLRYADAIVKRGVDKLIDAIAHSVEPQTKNAETQAQNATSNGERRVPRREKIQLLFSRVCIFLLSLSRRGTRRPH